MPLTELTPREKQVLVHYSNGKSPREIANLLGISRGAVSDHACEIIRKTNTYDIIAAVAFHLKQGQPTAWVPKSDRLGLSPVQRKVIHLRAVGYPPHKIAEKLQLKKRTIEWHMGRIRKVFGVANTLQAVLEYRSRRDLLGF